jgi:glycosyltransferase involved in cell wall biosynthesis
MHQGTEPDGPGCADVSTPESRRDSIPVTVMIFTLNEEIHLPSCFASVSWCEDIIVVDSFSTDATKEISTAAGAAFFQHRFEGFGKQRN